MDKSDKEKMQAFAKSLTSGALSSSPRILYTFLIRSTSVCRSAALTRNHGQRTREANQRHEAVTSALGRIALVQLQQTARERKSLRREQGRDLGTTGRQACL